MVPLGLSLSRIGWSVVNIGYPSRRGTIDAHVDTVRTRLESAGLDPSTELNFVTHSLGGVILRAFVSRVGTEYRFGKAVMLGPPNQGAAFARSIQRCMPLLNRVLGPSYLEVGTLDRPAATDRISVGIIAGTRSPERGYSPFVSGPNDGIVAVSETTLPGAADTLVVRGMHTFLMYQPTIMRQVAFFLNHGRFNRALNGGAEGYPSAS